MKDPLFPTVVPRGKNRGRRRTSIRMTKGIKWNVITIIHPLKHLCSLFLPLIHRKTLYYQIDYLPLLLPLLFLSNTVMESSRFSLHLFPSLSSLIAPLNLSKRIPILTSCCMILFRSIHISTNDPISFFVQLSSISLYLCTTSSLSIPLSMAI